MKALLILFIALSVVSSCNKADSETDDEQPGVWLTSFTGNYMDGFIKPTGLKMNYKKTKDDNGAILFELDHDGFACTYQTPEGETDNAKYNEYAKYYGDTTYTGRHNMSEREIVCTAPLKSINVVADRDFDESHPAGTSLNDIFTFKYLAYYSFVKNGYKNGGGDVPAEYPTDSVAVLSKFKGASLFSDYLSPLFLNKLPDAPGKYTFTVTLAFGEDPLTGEKVTVPPASIEIEF